MRVLVLMPSERDTERTVHLLKEANLPCAACAGMPELCRELRNGAGAVLLTDEMLRNDIGRQLEEALGAQPPWSALPILLLAHDGSGERLQQSILGAYTSVVILERPVRTRSLVSALRSALRTRGNQYQIRDAIRADELRRAELAAQEEKLRFALSAGRMGAWELDLENQELTCSEICKAVYGRPVDQPFTYAQLTESTHPDDRERVRATLDASLAARSLYDVEYRVEWPNGETHWAMVRGRAIYAADGRPLRIVGISIDVTERERLHEALRQSQVELAAQADELRTADRRKDEFLATLAHELRNPLAPISTGLSLLTRSTDPALSRKTLDIMKRQVDHIIRLVDDLLDISRITMGKLDLKRERISVVGVVEAAIEGSMPNLQSGRHELRVDLPETPLFLDADYTRIAQVLGNLLNNASKCTPEGGRIELSARREGDQVRISVSDNGMGLPSDRLQDIFQMFGQVNGPLDQAHGGLGIGLALVRKLVDMHGGSVEAHSPGPGQGSTFTVRLPLASAPETEEEHGATGRVPSGEGKLILVVDDNHDAAELLALLLEQDGYRTAIAHDGLQALDMARTQAPDVVILDIGLPGLSGYEVASRLRSDARLKRTGLIALTGWGSPDDMRKALDAGFDVHLTKPVSADDLHTALERASRRAVPDAKRG